MIVRSDDVSPAAGKLDDDRELITAEHLKHARQKLAPLLPTCFTVAFESTMFYLTVSSRLLVPDVTINRSKTES